MGKTITEKILSHCSKTDVRAGDLVECEPDTILAHDVSGPMAFSALERRGIHSVAAPDKLILVNDHFVPAKDIASAELSKQLRNFAKKWEIKNYFELGDSGICHALLPEKGLVKPGQVIIGGDSHTCTYGAVNAFSTGIGSTDLAFSIAYGRTWFKVPTSIKVEITGKPQKCVAGKDLVLELIGQIGVDGALYQSIEYCGEGIKNLTMEDRLTIANMCIEAGGKNSIFPFDEVTEKFMASKGVSKESYQPFSADPDALYSQVVKINLDTLEPIVACPSLPSNTKKVSEVIGIPFDQVFIGSCTNGWLTDLRKAANILKGKRIAKGIRVIVIPSTNNIYLEALKEGIVQTFVEAGCVVSTATCGPCCGAHMGVLGKKEICLSTTNRNFVGRMGDPTAEVYLCNPEVAAASALYGVITDPRNLPIHIEKEKSQCA